MSGNDPTTSSTKAPEAPSSPEPRYTGNHDIPFAQSQFAAAVQRSYDTMGDDSMVNRLQHQRDASLEFPAGENTALSSPVLKKPDRVRTVSWGNHTTSPLLPPANRNHLPSWDGVSPISAGGGGGPSAAAASVVKPKDLDLNDVVNAGADTEMEAETYILQAVEKYATHRQTDTETSRLYASIAEDEIKRSLDETFEATTASPPTSPLASAAATGPSSSPSGRPAPTRQPSNSTLNSNRTKFKTVVRRHMRASTVEGTLFGLTSALAELDETSSHTHRDHNHHRNDSIAYDSNFSAADKLNFAAQKMLKEVKNEKSNENNNSSSDGALDSGVEDKAAAAETYRGEEDPSNIGGDELDESRMSQTTRKNRRKRGSVVKVATDNVKEEWDLFNNFFSNRKDRIKAFSRKILLMIMLPSLGMAFFFFYVVNPGQCELPSANSTSVPTPAPTTLKPTPAPTVLVQEVYDVWSISTPDEDGLNATTVFPSNATTLFPSSAPSFQNETEKSSIGKDFIACPTLGASVSWWFLFLGVRQVLTFTMALVTQALVIDYLALSSRISLDWLGPIVTLLVVGSKGWPFILTFWAVFDMILLSGDKEYAHHWGYWQEWIKLFNEHNPSGNVVNNPQYDAILTGAIIVGVSVSVKRLVVGLFLGRQTFVHFGEQLAKVMKNMVMVGEVATLSREIEKVKDDFRDNYARQMTASSNVWNPADIHEFVLQEADEADAAAEPESATAADAANAFIANREENSKSNIEDEAVNRSMLSTRSVDSAIPADPEFTESEQVDLALLLDAWEEPTTVEEQEEKKVTIGAVLQFRQSLTFMKKKYPFLPAFGPADTREKCIESAQRVYECLLLRTPHRNELPFETLALLARNENGGIDQEKAKELIRAFRPDRDGTLGKLEFVKSIDVIYKELRLLSANIHNSSVMDKAVGSLINVVFYTVLVCILTFHFGENPIDIFLSITPFVLAFAFMFGKSSSKYFDGCLFILIQRPYGVGDRMHLSNPQNETSPDGSSGWIVEKVQLFTTTVYWGATNERATLCNGAISNLRVINAARSPNATIYVALKFGIDTEYDKIQIFRTAVEQFLKDRPREWLTFVGFRPTEVAVDKGYIGYKVIAQHRNSWQAIGGVIESKANLTTYCLEVAKQLKMRFMSPSLPVDLTMKEDSLGMPLDLPMLQGMPTTGELSAPSTTAPRDVQEALQAINTGLRQRKSAPKFADIVRMAMDKNKNK